MESLNELSEVFCCIGFMDAISPCDYFIIMGYRHHDL